jgi:hypothetical protein
MKPVIVCVIWLLFTISVYTTALAGSQWSPPIRIFALQVIESTGVVRLGVRHSLQRRTQQEYMPFFTFNPANCSHLTAPFYFAGDNGDEQTQYFDIQLDNAGRSTTEQNQMLNEIYAAYATSRNVALQVRDDLCTGTGGRVIAGIKVLY